LAGGIAPAIGTFLKTVSLDRVHLVVTSNGGTTNKRSGFKSVSDIVKKNNNENVIIDTLVGSIT